MNRETIELACIALGAVALLMQAIFLLALMIGAGKGVKKAQEEIEDLRSSVVPLLKDTKELVESARALLVRVGPKVESTLTDTAEVARNVRAQAVEVGATVDEVLEKVHKQADRVDTMFSGALDAVDQAAIFITKTVEKPVRQLSGVLAGIKAVVETLSSTNSNSHEPGIHQDKDMFI